MVPAGEQAAAENWAIRRSGTSSKTQSSSSTGRSTRLPISRNEPVSTALRSRSGPVPGTGAAISAVASSAAGRVAPARSSSRPAAAAAASSAPGSPTTAPASRPRRDGLFTTRPDAAGQRPVSTASALTNSPGSIAWIAPTTTLSPDDSAATDPTPLARTRAPSATALNSSATSSQV